MRLDGGNGLCTPESLTHISAQANVRTRCHITWNLPTMPYYKVLCGQYTRIKWSALAAPQQVYHLLPCCIMNMGRFYFVTIKTWSLIHADAGDGFECLMSYTRLFHISDLIMAVKQSSPRLSIVITRLIFLKILTNDAPHPALTGEVWVSFVSSKADLYSLFITTLMYRTNAISCYLRPCNNATQLCICM